ncbi:MAG: T9SS type A sorting domain-containing protein [Ginsengibacter sp.]
MLTKSLLKIFFGFALLLCANLLQAQPGTLDHTFGSGGRVLTNIPGNFGMGIRGLAVQTDGELIAGGYYNSIDGSVWMLGRYNSNGTLDNTFGVNGLDTSSRAFRGGSSLAYSVAIQSDGKIVAGGLSNNGSNLTLARYNANGSLDNSFGTNGITTISNIPGESVAYSIAIQNDGKILAGGDYIDFNGNYRFLLARLNTNGNFDSSFGTNGIAPEIVIGPTDDEIRSLAVGPDGKIIAAGYSQNSGGNYLFALARYNINGGLDSTFGSNGIVTTAIMAYAEAESVALQSDEKIVLSGISYNAPTTYFALTRYNTDGTLDNGFGIQTLAVDGGSQAYAMEIQNDGKIVEAGSLVGGRSNFAMVRYLPTGVLDNSFAVNGVDTTSMGSQNGAIAYAIRLVNSRIYLGGTTGNEWGLAAYINNAGALPVTYLNFDGILQNGNALLSWSTANEINNKGFEVQKSMDGQTFNDIGFVAGHGNSSQLHNYNYTDVKVLSGSNYYRLKQIDMDGRITYSSIIKLDYTKFGWAVLGNPSSNNSWVQVQMDKSANIIVQVVGMNGSVIQNTNEGKIEAGTYSIPLHLNNVSSGIYVLRLIVDGKSYSKEIIK